MIFALIFPWLEDQKNAQVLYCSCNTIWNNRKALEVSCGVWLKCVDDYCMVYKVICIYLFFVYSLVERWPLKGSYLLVGKRISCLIILFAYLL